MADTKPDISNLSLDDVISAENQAKAKKRKKAKQSQPQQQPQVNYENLSDDEIRNQLASRGLSTKGSRPKLVNRLKAEVQRAWAQFRKSNKNANFPPMMPQKKPKKKLSEEERNRIHAENEANRLAKAKRRAENIKKQEENVRRKRQKREENAAKQAQLKEEQRTNKEARQRCEVYVEFDLDEYKKILRHKFDPNDTKISSVSQDFSKKGFIVRFNNAKDAAAATRGSTMKKKKTIRSPLNASILPSPVESKCVFFQYPLDQNHPHLKEANSWTLKTNAEAETMTELKKLDLWISSAAKQFAKHGTIVNIFRERGFVVLSYNTEKAAEKCFTRLSKDGAFNGVPFHYLRTGTPTKCDRQVCISACKEAAGDAEM